MTLPSTSAHRWTSSLAGLRRTALIAVSGGWLFAASAQTGTPPVSPTLSPAASAAGTGKAKGADVTVPPAGTSSLGLPIGQGAGVHGANSPFPVLQARADVVPWAVLTDVKTRNEKNRLLPVFNQGQLGLNQKVQRIQGYMMPLDPGEKQTHFLLSSVPLTCSFCVAGGPESMVEVKTKTPVRYSMEPLVMEGRFLVLNDDSFGLYYRMTDASSVK